MANEADFPEELNDPEFVEDDHNETPPVDIVSYNELRSCADLFRMYDDGILKIDPDFQRDVVWPSSQQTRFIDSLIKQLPIPSMCIALDYKTENWIVIDGLQRMATIIKFLKGDDWRLSRLEDIDKEIAGKSAAAIKNSTGKLRTYFARVQNQSLPINVLRCDFSKKSHMEYLFTIFHRLNAGGIKLNNQEIRNCIYNGPFNDLLSKLDHRADWRKIIARYGLCITQSAVILFITARENMAQYAYCLLAHALVRMRFNGLFEGRYSTLVFNLSHRLYCL